MKGPRSNRRYLPKALWLYDMHGVVRLFYVIGNFVPITQKMLRGNRTAAKLNHVANATRRRRRILQAGFFLLLGQDPVYGMEFFVFRKTECRKQINHLLCEWLEML